MTRDGERELATTLNINDVASRKREKLARAVFKQVV